MFQSRRESPPLLNLCLIAANFPTVGRTTENGFLWPVARGLARQGHKVTVLTSGASEPEGDRLQDGIQVYFVGQNLGQFAHLALQKFSELHSKQPFHLVHSLDGSAQAIAELKTEFKVAVAYDVEATQLSQIFSILGMAQENLPNLLSTAINVTYKYLTTYLGHDRRLLNSADAVFVTSPPQRMALERYYLYPEMKTHLIPYGIELGDLSPREKSAELRQKLNLPENGQVVVTATDMTELAETINLLRAFEKVAVKRPSSRLLVVGNGPLFKQIEYETLCLALGSRVLFTGAISTGALSDYISLADVFVSLSARTSGFEPSLLEAMAQKKVVIGSEVSPISALIEDGLDGFLIRPADVPSLSELIQQVFNNEIDHHAIGDRARDKVVKLFDLERMMQQTLTAYRQAMGASGFFARPGPNSAPHPDL